MTYHCVCAAGALRSILNRLSDEYCGLLCDTVDQSLRFCESVSDIALVYSLPLTEPNPHSLYGW